MEKREIMSLGGLKISETGIVESKSLGLIEIRDDELLDEVYGGTGITINFYCPHSS